MTCGCIRIPGTTRLRLYRGECGECFVPRSLLLVAVVLTVCGLCGNLEAAAQAASSKSRDAEPAGAAAQTQTVAKITWQPWSDDLFERAEREKKFVLLDLEAVWCHWCHVMEQVTYHDPKVVELMNTRY